MGGAAKEESVGEALMAVGFATMITLALVGLMGCDFAPPENLDTARILADQGRYAEALPLFSELLDEDPQSPELNYLYGVALSATGNSGMAIWPLRKAVDDSEYALKAGTLLASALAKGAVPLDAIVYSDRVLALDPSHVEAWTIRGRANLALLDYDALLGDSERLLELAPQHGWGILWRIQAWIELGKLDEASDEIQTLQASAASVTNSFGVLPRLCVHEARLNEKRGDESGEKAVWVRCAKDFADNPDLVRAAVSHFGEKGADAEAIDALRNALHLRPEALNLRFQLAEYLAENGKAEAAELLLKEGIRVSPEVTEAHLELADFYRKREEYEKAIRVQAEIISRSEEIDTLVGAQYADDLIQLKRWDEFDAVVARLDSPAVLLLLRGRALLAQGNPKAALGMLRSGLELWPGNATATFLAGQAAEAIGRFEDAVGHYRDSLRADPLATDAVFRLFAIHEARGEWSHGLVALMHRIKADPEELRPQLLRIELLRGLRRGEMVTQALDVLEQLPQHYPAFVAEKARATRELTGSPTAAIEYIKAEDLNLSDITNVSVLEILVDSLLENGAGPEANELVNSAIEKNEEVARLHELEARTFPRNGKGSESATKALERALALDPQFPKAYAALAKLELSEGRKEMASEFYAKAMKFDGARNEYGWRLFELNPGWSQAEKRAHVTLLLDREPLDSRAALELARLEVDSPADLAAAQVWLDRSLAFRVGEAGWVTQGNLHLAQGAPEKALRSFRRALSLEPSSSNGLLGLAQATIAQGGLNEAQRILQRALSLPNFDQPEKAEALLAEISGRADVR